MNRFYRTLRSGSTTIELPPGQRTSGLRNQSGGGAFCYTALVAFPEPSVSSESSLEVSEVATMATLKQNFLVQRYVKVPCPSGKHRRSIVTFRNHTVAAMFSIPCEHAWTELTDHPALRDIGLDSVR
jgi:hypothetical protein